MKKTRTIITAACCLLLCHGFTRADYQELNRRFHRTTSHVTIRKVVTPTLANLDHAAYVANPLCGDPQRYTPKAPGRKIKPADCTFGGFVSCQCAAVRSTPLTKAEIGRAMAWEPLVKKLWEHFKADGFITIENAVFGQKWADSSVYVPYQKIAVAYMHGIGDSTQLWVKIEFMPWVKFITDMRDEDRDGFKEIYGKLSLEGIDAKLRSSLFDWMRSDYCAKELSKEEVVDWANILASYWYPKFNTDILDLSGKAQWPDDQTERNIVLELHGQVVPHPLIVMRGNPYGEPFYTIMAVDCKAAQSDTLARQGGPNEQPERAFDSDTVRTERKDESPNFKENSARFKREIGENGDYATWALKDSSWRNGLLRTIRALPAEQVAFAGRDGWLFFNKDIECMNAGDLANQPPDKNPIPHLITLQRYLRANKVSLLFVVIPDKAEVYFDKLPAPPPTDGCSIVNPFFRKLLKDVQNAGIEVIDLLPLFVAAKKDDATLGEGVYQKQDTHWTSKGVEIAAQAIAERIRKYPWYEAAAKTPVLYSERDTVCLRQGDLVDKIAPEARTAYPAVMLKAKQVFLPDGTLFKPANPQAPVLLMGDSFTGVFELVDCKGAGVGARIAAETKLPVDILTSWGGGPLIREKMVRTRAKYLSYKKVVVYLMVERDLYNYSQGWAPLEVK